MRKYEFAAEVHAEHGELGFRPKWIPHATPIGGAGVAHDILEHGVKDDGSTEAECMAFGAMMFVRGDNGYWSQTGSWHPEHVHIGSDFPPLLGFHRERGDGPIRICPKSVRDRDLQDRVAACLREGRRNLLEEFASGSDTDTFTARDITEMGRWIALGYRKAQRRYRSTESYNVCHTFMEIERRADELLKHAEEGQVLTVWLDPRCTGARVDLDYLYDPYYN